MINKYILVATIIATVFLFTAVKVHQSHHLTVDATFQVKYQSISSILRTNFTSISYFNNTVLVGDNAGSASIFTFDEKKNALSFDDITRASSAVLPPKKDVLKMQGTSTGILVLTEDGNLTTYALNSAKKIIGTIKWDLPDELKNFVLIESGNKFYLSAISSSQKQLCLYQLNESLVKPNPVTKLTCNQTNLTYEDIAYDSKNNLIAVGNMKSAYFFRLNGTDKNQLAYLCNAFMPAAKEDGYRNEFTNNGTLIAVNDLWVASIIIDVSVPSSKVISAQRTQRLLKSGGTDAVSVSKELGTKEKVAMVLINAKGKMEGFYVGSNSKLSYQGDSHEIGKATNFVLKNNQVFFTFKKDEILTGSLNTQANDFIKITSELDIASKNHYQPVKTIGVWNDVMITASAGGKNNLKVWKLNNYTMELIDEKSVSFFSLMKSGYVQFGCNAIIPPNKTNANSTLHAYFSGADPFEIYTISLTSDYKIKSVVQSKDAHFQTITGFFVTPSGQVAVSTSMDTLLMVWQISKGKDNVTHQSTITTKNGPISHSLQDKTGVYYVVAHSITQNDKAANISIWKLNEKYFNMSKVAQNVPGQAHQENLTSLLLSTDQKYIISLSTQGELRLWRHENWSMVDLLASLPTGITSDIQISMTDSNRLLVETKTQFTEYKFDFNGFVLVGKTEKGFETQPVSLYTDGNRLFSGDRDGSIRAFQLIE